MSVTIPHLCSAAQNPRSSVVCFLLRTYVLGALGELAHDAVFQMETVFQTGRAGCCCWERWDLTL